MQPSKTGKYLNGCRLNRISGWIHMECRCYEGNQPTSSLPCIETTWCKPFNFNTRPVVWHQGMSVCTHYQHMYVFGSLSKPSLLFKNTYRNCLATKRIVFVVTKDIPVRGLSSPRVALVRQKTLIHFRLISCRVVWVFHWPLFQSASFEFPHLLICLWVLLKRTFFCKSPGRKTPIFPNLTWNGLLFKLPSFCLITTISMAPVRLAALRSL